MKNKLKHVDPLLASPVQADEYWKENAGSFPRRGKPNSIACSRSAERGCLLAYDAGGELAGILFYYFTDVSMPPGSDDSPYPLEEAGNFTVHVRRDKRRQGWGTKLVLEAMRRWHADLSQQVWTPQGSLLRESLDRSGGT